MKRVILCGLGAVGITFGVKLKNCANIDFRVAVDEVRLKKYSQHLPILNGKEEKFKYILAHETFSADLIIISTKYQGLESAINLIKNFTTKDTRIISLINGISSEERISELLPDVKVLKSYFIGHSAMRVENSIIHDGVGEIVTEKDSVLEEIFHQSKIKYSFSDDIEYSMWVKFALNLFSNQTSAILKMTFGEMKNNPKFIEFAKKIVSEIIPIAEKKGIKNLKNLEKDALIALQKMCDEGKTSMYQDILAKRPTEIEIFAGEIIKLGKMYGICTPYNQVLYDLIKIEEGKF